MIAFWEQAVPSLFHIFVPGPIASTPQCIATPHPPSISLSFLPISPPAREPFPEVKDPSPQSGSLQIPLMSSVLISSIELKILQDTCLSPVVWELPGFQCWLFGALHSVWCHLEGTDEWTGWTEWPSSRRLSAAFLVPNLVNASLTSDVPQSSTSSVSICISLFRSWAKQNFLHPPLHASLELTSPMVPVSPEGHAQASFHPNLFSLSVRLLFPLFSFHFFQNLCSPHWWYPVDGRTTQRRAILSDFKTL